MNDSQNDLKYDLKNDHPSSHFWCHTSDVKVSHFYDASN